MDLIERYLAAVGLLLPQSQREDITAELRDVLLNRHEEKERSLGRRLTRDEESALLREFGHPMRVAARYGPRQYLIGPEIYPIYIFVLKIVLACIALSAVLAGVVNGVVTPGEPGPAIVKALGVLWTGSFAGAGAVTAVFAVLEHYQVHFKVLEQWNPRDLPAKPRKRQPSWIDSVAAIVVQTVFVLWWTRVITLWQSFIPLKAGQSLSLVLAPIWTTLYWPVIALSFGIIGVHVLKLMGPAQRRAALGANIIVQVASLIVAGLALRAGHWVDVTGSGLAPKALWGVYFGVNLGIQITLAIIAIVAVCAIAYDLWRLYRGRAATAA